MLQPTPGFIPPPVPLVPVAANGIVATGGLLAGAAAGARAGAILGPKGAIAGAVVGGLILPLVFPSPTAPGTVPGLDPGVNDPTPVPGPEGWPEPQAPYEVGPAPGDAPGTLYDWEIERFQVWVIPGTIPCFGGGSPGTTLDLSGDKRDVFTGEKIRYSTNPAILYRKCNPGEDDKVKRSIGVIEGFRNGQWEVLNNGGGYDDGVFYGQAYSLEPTRSYYKNWRITRDSVVVPTPPGFEPDSSPSPLPRPDPIPVRPLGPPCSPPEPLVPLPEPEPPPNPLNPPSPDNPNGSPIAIPSPLPANPQPVPGTCPDPLPGSTPAVPVPVLPPVPIPGVPPITEPSPNPDVVPAPGPAPGTDPEPDTAPLPQPNPLPIPGRPTVPTVPDTSTPTIPDGSIAPRPNPPLVPTPPGVHFPVPGAPPITDGGTRPDLTAIAAEVGRIEQKVARLQNGQGFPDLSDLLFLLPLLLEFLEGDIPGTTYRLQGICEDVGEEADQPVSEFPVAPAKNLGAVINRLDTIDEMLQQHLAWKTPTCSRRPVLAGDWRTITFISDESSGTRGDRLRKRFRYRSLSGIGLPGVIDHWATFTWQAGAVCVQHAGSTWGTPQVWASSIDEGKRVIRHAAGEAGIDPDKDGRWVISGSNSARIGLPGTMRVNRKGGYYWITARDGPAGAPIVGTTP